MNGDVICNGRAALHRLLKHSGSRAPDSISVQLIQSSRLICTQTEPHTQPDGRRGGAVNGDFLLPAVGVKDEQTCSLRSYIPAHKRRRANPVQRSKARATVTKSPQNRKVTDYYPIRRSSRKSKSELKYEEKQHIDTLITNGIENGMMVRYIEGKGRGVFSTQTFQKGQYVVEYHGDLLQLMEAREREAAYAQDPSAGCYMYYFQYLSKTYCVDATQESERLGRLINHSKTGNLQTKLHDIGGRPHLILVASRDIAEGEELLYDYGDRSKASIEAHPWLKH